MSIREKARKRLYAEAARQNRNLETGKGIKGDQRVTSNYGPRTKVIMDEMKDEEAMDRFVNKRSKK